MMVGTEISMRKMIYQSLEINIDTLTIKMLEKKLNGEEEEGDMWSLQTACICICICICICDMWTLQTAFL